MSQEYKCVSEKKEEAEAAFSASSVRKLPLDVKKGFAPHTQVITTVPPRTGRRQSILTKLMRCANACVHV